MAAIKQGSSQQLHNTVVYKKDINDQSQYVHVAMLGQKLMQGGWGLGGWELPNIVLLYGMWRNKLFICEYVLRNYLKGHKFQNFPDAAYSGKDYVQ